MYYRHIYASIQGGPSLEQRFESYRNYVQLFNAILSAEKPLELELPIHWLWDIIDEFIYQVIFWQILQWVCQLNNLHPAY